MWQYAHKLLNKQYDGFQLPQWWADYQDEIYANLYDFKTIKHYCIFHDIGKPDCLVIDENGKRHFPDHAARSYELWNELFPERKEIAELIAHDMDFHALSAEQIINQNLSKQQLATLILVSLAELHSNANLFGGTDSDSFKIKCKKWSKNAKKIAEKYFHHEYMYVIVRNDLSPAQKAVQSGHALIEASRKFLAKDAEHPSVIICVVKSEAKLIKCCEELRNCGIQFEEFREPDIGNQLTAIASKPLFGKDREAFKRFQLLR